MVPHRPAIFALVAFILLTACTPAQRAASSSASESDAQPVVSRTLQVGDHYEPDVLASKYAGSLASAAKRLMNAGLTLVDSGGVVRPYLAEATPRLNTDTWRVFLDGRMETTYRLKPGLTWHDGTPLSAQDFVLAWKVYSHPGLGVFGTAPQDRMEQVTGPDERTVVITWRTPSLDAGELDFAPLPRHLIEQSFADLNGGVTTPEAFINMAYWRTEFVGLGPYRLTRWEPGAFVEGEAFAGHALGRPKIDRVVVRSVPDENTMLTNVLAGQFHLTVRLALRFEHAQVLLKSWEQNQQGVVILDPSQPRHTQIQFRPELANPPAILDLRVRRAILRGLDKQAIVDGLFEGIIQPGHSFVPRTAPHASDIERAVTKYPYDPRQSEALMAEAGFRKAADGMFVSAAGERFTFEHMSIAGNQNERQGAIMANSWRNAGFDVKETTLSNALTGDGQARSSFPALSSVASGSFDSWASAGISTPANRWRGGNRGGWANPDYDRVYEQYLTSLDRMERNRFEVEMMKLVTENASAIFLFHNPDVFSYLAELRGPAPVSPDASIFWNVQDWTLG